MNYQNFKSPNFEKIKSSELYKCKNTNSPDFYESSIFNDLIGSCELFDREVLEKNQKMIKKRNSTIYPNPYFKLSSNQINKVSSGIIPDHNKNKLGTPNMYFQTIQTPKTKYLNTSDTSKYKPIKNKNNIFQYNNNFSIKPINLKNNITKKLKTPHKISNKIILKNINIKDPNKTAKITTAVQIDNLLEKIDDNVATKDKEEHFNNTENIFHSLFKKIKPVEEIKEQLNEDEDRQVQRKIMLKKIFKKKKNLSPTIPSFKLFSEVLSTENQSSVKEKDIKNSNFLSKIKNKKLKKNNTLRGFGLNLEKVSFYFKTQNMNNLKSYIKTSISKEIDESAKKTHTIENEKKMSIRKVIPFIESSSSDEDDNNLNIVKKSKKSKKYFCCF